MPKLKLPHYRSKGWLYSTVPKRRLLVMRFITCILLSALTVALPAFAGDGVLVGTWSQLTSSTYFDRTVTINGFGSVDYRPSMIRSEIAADPAASTLWTPNVCDKHNPPPWDHIDCQAEEEGWAKAIIEIVSPMLESNPKSFVADFAGDPADYHSKNDDGVPRAYSDDPVAERSAITFFGNAMKSMDVGHWRGGTRGTLMIPARSNDFRQNEVEGRFGRVTNGQRTFQHGFAYDVVSSRTGARESLVPIRDAEPAGYDMRIPGRLRSGTGAEVLARIIHAWRPI